MTAVKRDLYIEQGATFVLSFQWCAQGDIVDGVITPGPPKDLTGWIFRMDVRKNQHDTPIVAVNSTTPTANDSMIYVGVDPTDLAATDPLASPAGTPDPTNGWIRVVITDDDTDLMDQKTTKYDLEAEDPANGFVYRLLQGGVTVDPNITQEVPADPVVGE